MYYQGGVPGGEGEQQGHPGLAIFNPHQVIRQFSTHTPKHRHPSTLPILSCTEGWATLAWARVTSFTKLYSSTSGLKCR